MDINHLLTGMILQVAPYPASYYERIPQLHPSLRSAVNATQRRL